VTLDLHRAESDRIHNQPDSADFSSGLRRALIANEHVDAQAPGGNVTGIMLPNARLSDLGAIVQDWAGTRGCIAAMQIRTTTLNNTPGQMLLMYPCGRIWRPALKAIG